MTDHNPVAELHLTQREPIAVALQQESRRVLSGEALSRLLRERIEQVERHGYTRSHDADHQEGEIGLGALAYLCAGLAVELGDGFDEAAARQAACLDSAANVWPWPRELFRPHDYETCLVKAGAMILAELDRKIAAREQGAG